MVIIVINIAQLPFVFTYHHRIIIISPDSTMRISTTLLPWSSLLGVSLAACPFAHIGNLKARDDGESTSRSRLEPAEVDDSDGFMTSDVGGPIGEQRSLRAGLRGPTALEDFIFRQKLQHFDHERVRLLTAFR